MWKALGLVPGTQNCNIWAHNFRTVSVYYHLATLFLGHCRTEHHDGQGKKWNCSSHGGRNMREWEKDKARHQSHAPRDCFTSLGLTTWSSSWKNILLTYNSINGGIHQWSNHVPWSLPPQFMAVLGTKLSMHESVQGLLRSKPQYHLSVAGIIQSVIHCHREKTEFSPGRQSFMSRSYLDLTRASHCSWSCSLLECSGDQRDHGI